MRRLFSLKALIVGMLLFLAAAPVQGAGADKSAPAPHPGFVYLTDVIPDLVLDMRYHGTNNFIGDRVDGYAAPVAILSAKAANGLKRAGDILRPQGYGLKIFDAYRPQSAVDHFVRWARDVRDTRQKAIFYHGCHMILERQ